MRHRNLLVFFGLFTIFMGIGLFFFPDVFYLILSVPAAPTTTLFMRFFAVLLFLEGVFFYGSRNTLDLRVIKSFYGGSIFADLIMGFLSIYAAYTGVVNFVGYFFGGLFFLFAAIYAFGMFQIKRITKI